MKKITWTLLMGMILSTSAFAEELTAAPYPAPTKTVVPGEVTKCWFSTRHEGQFGNVRCEAKVIERAVPMGSVMQSGERVKLKVECSNRFDLFDEYAKEFHKNGKEFVLGTDDGKIALLKIRDEEQNVMIDNRGRKQDATLIISSPSRQALRLEGRCVEKDEVLDLL